MGERFGVGEQTVSMVRMDLGKSYFCFEIKFDFLTTRYCALREKKKRKQTF